MKNDSFFLKENPSLKSSGLYIAFETLKIAKRNPEIAIYDLFEKLKTKIHNLNYFNFINALTFLYMSEVLEFKKPYLVFKKAEVKSD
jgi:hypothetical protein